MAMSQTIEPSRNGGLTPTISPIIAPEIRALEGRVNDASQWVAPLKRQMATVIVGQRARATRGHTQDLPDHRTAFGAFLRYGE